GCAPCDAGTYSQDPGADSCTPCDAGTYSTATGADSASTCTPCEAGTYSAASGLAGSCTACPLDSYASEPGSSSCLPCPADQTTSSTGATACEGALGCNNAGRGCGQCQTCAVDGRCVAVEAGLCSNPTQYGSKCVAGVCR
ncbi:hypothetical protein CHLNCDRAFT_28701, partial [Chlorella variabilis]